MVGNVKERNYGVDTAADSIFCRVHDYVRKNITNQTIRPRQHIRVAEIVGKLKCPFAHGSGVEIKGEVGSV